MVCSLLQSYCHRSSTLRKWFKGTVPLGSSRKAWNNGQHRKDVTGGYSTSVPRCNGRREVTMAPADIRCFMTFQYVLKSIPWMIAEMRNKTNGRLR